MDAGAGLTPPEAMVLMDTDVRSAQVFKVAVMALMLQRRVRVDVEQRRGVFGTRPVMRMRADAAPGQPGPLQAALAVVRRTGGGTLKDVAAEARSAYGQNLHRYVYDEVIPALVRRGLVTHVIDRVMWVVRLHQTTLTPDGRAARARLQAVLDQGRAVPGFLDRDPRQAAMIVASLGTLVLLVPELRPHLQRVARMLPDEDPGMSADVSFGGSDSHGSERHGPGDGTGFDAFGGAQGGFESGFGASFDAAFDGGGGDSGGSDSGGGGSGGE